MYVILDSSEDLRLHIDKKGRRRAETFRQVRNKIKIYNSIKYPKLVFNSRTHDPEFTCIVLVRKMVK